MKINILDQSKQAIALVELRKSTERDRKSIAISFCDTAELVAISKYQVIVREI